MDINQLLQFIEVHGYIGLFFLVWLGIFGLPIPNEILSMSVGLASSKKVLHPLITFFVLYAGIIAALSTCYLSGKYVGRPLISYFEKRKRYANLIDKSFKFIDKYHAFSLSLSYFLPGIRNFVPFLYGFSRLPFRTFSLFSFGGAFIWLCITFPLGYWFGDQMNTIVLYGKEALILLLIVFAIIFIISIVLWKKRKKTEMMKGQELEKGT